MLGNHLEYYHQNSQIADLNKDKVYACLEFNIFLLLPSEKYQYQSFGSVPKYMYDSFLQEKSSKITISVHHSSEILNVLCVCKAWRRVEKFACVI